MRRLKGPGFGFSSVNVLMTDSEGKRSQPSKPSLEERQRSKAKKLQNLIYYGASWEEKEVLLFQTPSRSKPLNTGRETLSLSQVSTETC